MIIAARLGSTEKAFTHLIPLRTVSLYFYELVCGKRSRRNAVFRLAFYAHAKRVGQKDEMCGLNPCRIFDGDFARIKGFDMPKHVEVRNEFRYPSVYVSEKLTSVALELLLHSASLATFLKQLPVTSPEYAFCVLQQIIFRHENVDKVPRQGSAFRCVRACMRKSFQTALVNRFQTTCRLSNIRPTVQKTPFCKLFR